MPIITVQPNNPIAERLLVELAPKLLPNLRGQVQVCWGTPNEAIIVRINKCSVLVNDLNSADVDVWVEATPNPKLESRADTLRDMLAICWAKATDSRLSAEFWIRFVPGSWCVVQRFTGQILDREDMSICFCDPENPCCGAH